MFGLEAIEAHNGWAISVVGITIVFSGLVTLSLVISQLHKVLAIWENPGKLKAIFKSGQSRSGTGKEGDSTPEKAVVFSESQKEVAKQFSLLARTMEDHFPLPRLLHLAQISDLKDPHSHLNVLLKSGIIKPDGSGYFIWDKLSFERAISSKS